MFLLEVHALSEERMARKKGIICTGEVEGGKMGVNRRESGRNLEWSGERSEEGASLRPFLHRLNYRLECFIGIGRAFPAPMHI
jgi:hypothetical protein